MKDIRVNKIKKWFVIHLFIGSAVLSCQKPVNKVESEVETSKKVETMKEKFTIGKYKVTPLGWSEEGNFAYFLYYDIGDLCGYCPVFAFKVQSIVSDKILYSKEFDALKEESEQSEYSLSEIEKSNRALIDTQLKKYHIQTKKSFSMESGDFEHSGKSYSIELKQKEGTFEGSAMGNDISQKIISSLQVILEKKEPGKPGVQKTVFKHSEKEGDSSHMIGAQYMGYFQSPYEGRIVILLKTNWMSCCFEGTSETEGVQLIGAHLETGFK